jgi:predicted XRE-type DNA-binding protein
MVKQKFPSRRQIEAALKRLEGKPASRMLPPDASPVDRAKFAICKQFVVFHRENKVSQRDLAKRVGVDEALMSKILHYHIDEFTTDRLIKFLAVLFPEVRIEIKGTKLKGAA